MKNLKIFFTCTLFLAFGLELATATASKSILISKKSIFDDDRPISDFSEISVSGNYNVYITMSNSESLRLEGDEDAIDGVDIKVEKGILKISDKKQINKRSWKKNGKLRIYVQAKKLKSIILSGSGNIEVKGKIKSSELKNMISGSGSISANIDVEDYICIISGSGEINVQGEAKNAKITIAGSGDFEGEDLKTNSAEVVLSGSGDVSIITDKRLDVKMSGSGNIRYGGEAIVRSTKIGSGSISKDL